MVSEGKREKAMLLYEAAALMLESVQIDVIVVHEVSVIAHRCVATITFSGKSTRVDWETSIPRYHVAACANKRAARAAFADLEMSNWKHTVSL